MNYCTVDDLAGMLPKAELVELADDSEDRSGAWDSPAVVAVMQDAIRDASQEIDGYVGLVATLPLDPAPGLLRPMAARMAIAILFCRRPDGPPEHWQDQRDASRKTLEQIATGKIKLVQDPAPGQETKPEPMIEVSAPRRVFGERTWREYRGRR